MRLELSLHNMPVKRQGFNTMIRFALGRFLVYCNLFCGANMNVSRSMLGEGGSILRGHECPVHGTLLFPKIHI